MEFMQVERVTGGHYSTAGQAGTGPGLPMRRAALAALPFLAVLPLLACGGGGGGSAPASPPPPPQVQVSVTGSVPAGCGSATGGTFSPAAGFTADSAVQAQVAVDPVLANARYGLWQQDRWNAIGARAIAFSNSADGGSTWAAPVLLPFSVCGAAAGTPGAAYDRASDPAVAAAAGAGTGGVVLASALAFSAAGFLQPGGTSGVLVSRSADGGRTWSVPLAAIADTGPASGPAWFNDRDSLAVDSAGGHVYLFWDRIPSDTSNYSAPTWMLHSADAGLTWDAARVVFDPGGAPGAKLQAFNNQAVVLPGGRVVDVFTLFPLGLTFAAPQLVAMGSTDHGLTWTALGSATAATGAYTVPITSITAPSLNSAGGWLSSPVPGGPPVRDSPNMAQIAADPQASPGTLALVWEDASFSSSGVIGIAFSRSTDGGATWSAARRINPQSAVPAFDPSVSIRAGGEILVTYYDWRDFVAGSSVLSTSLWALRSNDGGASWQESRVSGPFDLNQAPAADLAAGSTGNALFLGDQQGLAATASGWLALYAQPGAQGTRVRASQLTP